MKFTNIPYVKEITKNTWYTAIGVAGWGSYEARNWYLVYRKSVHYTRLETYEQQKADAYCAAQRKLPSVFDSFNIPDIFFNFNSIATTLILLAIFFFSLIYIKKTIKGSLIKLKTTEYTNINGLYNFFYTSTIELSGRKGSRIFGLFVTIFVYLVILNITGLLLFAVTVKSQLSTTFWFSLTIFISCILMGIRNKGVAFFQLFWNTSVDIVMRVLLLLVEVLSFSIRPLSYALRLFANLLSGHILLHLFSKVINLLRKKRKVILATIPFVLLCAFGILETLIAGLQSFIPATLLQIWMYETY